MAVSGAIPHSGPVLSARAISKSFGSVQAVSNLSLDLEPGEALALVGPNGAGKTTTLRMLATLLPHDSGDITIMGRSAKDPFNVRHFIGYMPDVLGVYPEMLVSEYLEFFARAYGIEEHLISYAMDEVTAFAGLEPFLGSPAYGLSRGMLQRVSLARALLHDPPVLLLDEPAAGLDPRSRSEFRQMLMQLRVKGKAAVISSHILSDLEETCTRIAVMDHGEIQLNEEMAQFLARSRGLRTFRVTVCGDREKAHAILAGRSDAAALRWDGETLLFEFTGNHSKASEVLGNLVREGVEVEGFAEIPLSLEQAYLARTDVTTIQK
jgi:ABC-2 type transport system ATP-binding protein